MITVRPYDKIVCACTSLVSGNTGLTSQLAFALRDILKSVYGSARPVLMNFGTPGQTMAQFHTNVVAECTAWNPDIVLIDGCPNDLGVSQGTLDTMWTDLTTVANYPGGKLPRCVGMYSTSWRGSEATGGTGQSSIVVDNPLIQARTIANNGNFSGGTTFLDVWSLWASRRPRVNPQNLDNGFWTTDGTHFTALGSQIYAEVFQNNATFAQQ